MTNGTSATARSATRSAPAFGTGPRLRRGVCLVPLTLATNGIATFRVTATVAPTAVDGNTIVNEIAAAWLNDPFGPEFSVGDGNSVGVTVAPAVEPRFTS